MIKSFASKETAALFANQRVLRFSADWLPVARRKLAQLNRVQNVEE
jgi:proteic killer suppression protein